MKKREELTDPNSCMSRASDDEPTFVLLARDVAAPVVVLEWVAVRLRLGKNQPEDPQIAEAMKLAIEMIEYRKSITDAVEPPAGDKPPLPPWGVKMIEEGKVPLLEQLKRRSR